MNRTDLLLLLGVGAPVPGGRLQRRARWRARQRRRVRRRLDTTPRFIRRLIAERRIEYHKVGRHVRIAESALAEFIEAGKVPPLSAEGLRPKLKGVA